VNLPTPGYGDLPLSHPTKESAMRHPAGHFLGESRNGVIHVPMNLNLAFWTGWEATPFAGPVRDTDYPGYLPLSSGTEKLLQSYQMQEDQVRA
jgi:hypothetical protein